MPDITIPSHITIIYADNCVVYYLIYQNINRKKTTFFLVKHI